MCHTTDFNKVIPARSSGNCAFSWSSKTDSGQEVTKSAPKEIRPRKLDETDSLILYASVLELRFWIFDFSTSKYADCLISENPLRALEIGIWIDLS